MSPWKKKLLSAERWGWVEDGAKEEIRGMSLTWGNWCSVVPQGTYVKLHSAIRATMMLLEYLRKLRSVDDEVYESYIHFQVGTSCPRSTVPPMLPFPTHSREAMPRLSVWRPWEYRLRWLRAQGFQWVQMSIMVVLVDPSSLNGGRSLEGFHQKCSCL